MCFGTQNGPRPTMAPDLRGGPEVAVAALLTIARADFEKRNAKKKKIPKKMETPRVTDVAAEEATATLWLETSLGGSLETMWLK